MFNCDVTLLMVVFLVSLLHIKNGVLLIKLFDVCLYLSKIVLSSRVYR